MLEKSLGILFYLKHPRNHDGNSIPVYLRITVDGVPCEISTKRKWDPLRWDSRKGRASGSKEDVKALNTFIELLAHKVHEARRKLIDANKEVSAAAIKNLLFGVDDKKYIIQIFLEHNALVSGISQQTLDLLDQAVPYMTNMPTTYQLLGLLYRKFDIDPSRIADTIATLWEQTNMRVMVTDELANFIEKLYAIGLKEKADNLCLYVATQGNFELKAIFDQFHTSSISQS